jgi:hypothetical protein
MKLAGLFMFVMPLSGIIDLGEGACEDKTGSILQCKECCAELRMDYEFLNYSGIPVRCRCQGDLFTDDDDLANEARRLRASHQSIKPSSLSAQLVGHAAREQSQVESGARRPGRALSSAEPEPAQWAC